MARFEEQTTEDEAAKVRVRAVAQIPSHREAAPEAASRMAEIFDMRHFRG